MAQTGTMPKVAVDKTYSEVFVFYQSAGVLYFYTSLNATPVTVGSFPDANKTDFDVDWDEQNMLTVKYRDAADALQTWASRMDGVAGSWA